MSKRLTLLFIALLLLSCKLPGTLLDSASPPGTAAPPSGASSPGPAAGQPTATASQTPVYVLLPPNPMLTHGAGSKASPTGTAQVDIVQPATETPTPPAALPTVTPGPSPTAFPVPTQSAAEIAPLTATPERTVIPPPYDPVSMKQNWSALATSSATEAAFLCSCAQVIYVCEKMPYGNRPSCSFRCISVPGGDKYGIDFSVDSQICNNR